MKTHLFSFLLLVTSFSYAQSVEINPAGSASGIITSTATNKGMLVPRMTAAERSAISSPANGLLVYQTDGVAGFYFYNGTAWAVLGGGSGSQGPAGLNTLVKTTTEAAGANCTTGGVKLEYGLDANSNNTLDAGEIVPALTKYICNGAVGQQGPQGIQGLTGATGSQGATGVAGANGKTVLNGTANPVSGTGTDGDFYINTSTNRLFGPKAGGAWSGSGVALVGPTGATGATGPQGAAGQTGATGATGLQGIQGLTGATGPAGAVGQGVPIGGTANQVLAKIDGTNYNTQWVTPASGGSDNLGNHTATQALDMANNNITNTNKFMAKDLGFSGTTSFFLMPVINVTSAHLDATGVTFLRANTGISNTSHVIHGIAGGYEGKLLYLDLRPGTTWAAESTTETTPTNRLSRYFMLADPYTRTTSERHLLILIYMRENPADANTARWVVLEQLI